VELRGKNEATAAAAEKKRSQTFILMPRVNTHSCSSL